MQVARLQPLNLNAWGPVIDAATGALEDIKGGITPSFELTFLGTDYQPAPYVQASANYEGNLVLEIISNDYLQTKLTKWHENQLRVLGFKVPDNENPNYHRVSSSKDSNMMLANLLLDCARRVFDLTESTWFIYGDSEYEKALAESDAFWHNKSNPLILCLPGQNQKFTVEGSALA